MKLAHSQNENDEAKEIFIKKTTEFITPYDKQLMENEGRLKEVLLDLNMKH